MERFKSSHSKKLFHVIAYSNPDNRVTHEIFLILNFFVSNNEDGWLKASIYHIFYAFLMGFV